ncbi:hypothetical protein PSAG_04535 [Fusobacterium animalis D11]|uniref:Uncharacterized protein n=1 Tax=Fusobacterium animalis D11 TaxID=556264 RepID=A0A0K9CP85_9FUSO|nr:hypothetical protein [Fusobacterium nucleatum]KMV76087.1 hypothetical protein PSAG_04535 [Fusobacterium animalis D11]MCL4585509.1 hypothetical protein [Fusobacterium nucleatum YWH7055]
MAKPIQKNEEDIKKELKEEVKNEIQEDIKEKEKEDVKTEVKEEVKNEIQEDIKEEEKKDIKTEVKKEEKEVEENLQKIYIGPTIAAFSLQENTVFVNEYPFNVQEAIKKYPLTEKLFINIEDLKSRNNEYYRTLYNTLNNELRGNINGI